jgi:LuxR family maltose regulon positive regulatory protein
MTAGADEFPRALLRTTPRTSSSVIDRPRLLNALLPLAPLTVVRAPAGAGKTVLCSQLVAGLDARGVWVTVDGDIAGREGFWRFTIGGLLGPERAQRHLGGDAITTSGLIDAFRSAGAECVVVIDDAHLLKGPEALRDVIAITRAVPDVRFMVAARVGLSELVEPAVVLELDVRTLLPDELAFSTAEVAAFVDGMALSAEDVHAASGGNALLMRAITHPGATDASSTPASGARGIADAYVRRLLSTLDPSTRRFMALTCIGRDFTVEDTQTLVGPGDHSAALAEIESAGVLTRTGDGLEERLRYHPLVREVIYQDVTQDREADLPRLHAAVATQRLAVGNYAGALHHAILAADYESATEALVRGGAWVLRAGPANTVTKISLKVALRHPLLATARAVVENARGHRWVAREFFAAAVAGSRAASKRVTPERVTLTVSESAIARLHGNKTEAVAAARRAIELIDRLGSDAFGEQVNELLAICGVTFFRTGEFHDLEAVIERVPVSAIRGGVSRAGLEAILAAAEGDLDRLATVEGAVTAAGWPSAALDSYSGTLLRLAQLIRDLGEGRFAEARRRFDRMPAPFRKSSEFRPIVTAAESLADILAGSPEHALRRIAAMRRSERASRRLSDADERLLILAEAVAMAAGDDLVGARRRLRTLSADDPIALLLRAHVALLDRDADYADRALGAPELPKGTTPRIARAWRLLAAWHALENDDAPAARRYVQSAGRMASSSGDDGAAMLLPLDIRVRLRALFEPGDADRHGPDPAALGQLSTSLPAPFALRDQRPHLTARELVVLRALRDGVSNNDLAAELRISRNTLKSQLRSGYQKLGVSTRAEARARLASLGLLGEGDDQSGHGS